MPGGVERVVTIGDWKKGMVFLLMFVTVGAGFSACSLIREKAGTPVAAPPPPGREPGYAVLGKVYYPLKSAEGFSQVGLASWYGEEFQGRKTASGEIYDMHALTAAHKLLPFDTFVLVRNLENGKEITVRINDRGPFVRGRIIDLSYRAASELGLIGPGTARVQVIALGKRKTIVENGKVETVYELGENYGIGNFAVQVGSFRVKQNAQRLVEKLRRRYANVHIHELKKPEYTLYQVRVAGPHTLTAARKQAEELRREGFKDSFVISE